MTQEFEFTEEIVELRSMVRAFCEEFSPEDVVRRTMESGDGWDPALWRRLGSELGVLGLSAPEAFGGDDVGLVAQAVVLEELGAALVCGPVLGTLVLAIPTLTALPDDEVKQDLLPSLCRGESTATVVAPLSSGRFDASSVSVVAHPVGDGWELTGEVAQAPDTSGVDTLLVVATTPDGPALFRVDAGSSGLTVVPLTTMDQTRTQAAVSFDRAPARPIANPSDTDAALASAVLTGSVLLAAEQLGGSQRMLDATVAHVSTRIQFGQPIGAFQAVKHRCANMLIAVEQARSAVYHAAWALQEGTDDVQLAASLAQAVATETYSWVSTSAIQMHGGLGFTWEGAPHLYFKRATTDAATLGAATNHFDVVGRRTIDEVAGVAG